MRRLKRSVAAVLLFVMIGAPVAEAVDSKKATYIGGTIGKFSTAERKPSSFLDLV